MRRTRINESTKAFFRLHGKENWHKFVHGYIYLAYLETYVKVLVRGFRFLVRSVPAGWVETFRPVFAYVPDRYHAKVLSHEDARKIVSLHQDISVPHEKADKVVPFEIANQIVIRNPDSIVVMDCACRKEKKNPCQPLDVCMIIGEPYASFMLEHGEKLGARRVSKNEAIALLEACHLRGNVHNAYFKDAMGDQFFAICNCCSCCCAGLEGHRLLSGLPLAVPIKELASSGYVSRITTKKCRGCRLCVDRCPFGALVLDGEKAVAMPDKCLGCSVCVDVCPQGAIKLRKDPSRGIPLDVQALQGASKSRTRSDVSSPRARRAR